MPLQDEDVVAVAVAAFAAWALVSAGMWARSTPKMFFRKSYDARRALAAARKEAAVHGQDSNPSSFTAHAKAQRRVVAAEKALDAAANDERAAHGALYRWTPTLVRWVILYGALLPLWALYGDEQLVMVPHAVTSFGIAPLPSDGFIRGGGQGRPMPALPFLAGLRSLNGPAWYLLCHFAFRFAAAVLFPQRQ